MADLENNIPTLTDIAHKGNEEMLNHFDAHQFEEEGEEKPRKEVIEEEVPLFSMDDINALQTAVTLDSSIEANMAEPEEIPSIQLNDEPVENIESEDFSEVMESMPQASSENADDNLKAKIDQAISEALPDIEVLLKESLYSKFGL